MSHPARSLQYLGTDIGHSSHLPVTTEPHTNHNTTYNDNNNNTTIATATGTTALTCVLVMLILMMLLTKTLLTLRTTLYNCWVYTPWKSLKPTSLTRGLLPASFVSTPLPYLVGSAVALLPHVLGLQARNRTCPPFRMQSTHNPCMHRMADLLDTRIRTTPCTSMATLPGSMERRSMGHRVGVQSDPHSAPVSA